MMGIKERTFQPLPDDLSLEVLVPKDNFYRRQAMVSENSLHRKLSFREELFSEAH